MDFPSLPQNENLLTSLEQQWTEIEVPILLFMSPENIGRPLTEEREIIFLTLRQIRGMHLGILQTNVRNQLPLLKMHKVQDIYWSA